MKRWMMSAVLLMTLRLAAGDGRIPIASAPLTITAPGSYYLTRDLAPASGNAVVINADNVTLDLNGHLITAVAGSYGIYALNRAEVTVRGGRITGGNYGIGLISSSAPPVTPHFRIEGVEVTGAAAAGLYVSGTAANRVRAELIGNRVTNTAGNGISAQYLEHSRVENNLVLETVTGASGGGSCISLLSATGSVVAGNQSSLCQFEGITLFQGVRNRVEGNVANNAGGVGIRVYSTANANVVKDNSAFGCGSGVEVTGNGNLVDGNLVTASGGVAINLSGNSNGYSGNHTMNNGTNGVAVSGSGNFNGGGNY